MRNLEQIQRLVIYTVDSEDGLEPIGANISEEDLAELINTQTVVTAHNQVGDLITVSFDMDFETLVVERLKENPARDNDVLASQSLLVDILYGLYKPERFSKSEAQKVADWYVPWVIDAHYMSIQKYGFTLLRAEDNKFDHTVKILANGGAQII